MHWLRPATANCDCDSIWLSWPAYDQSSGRKLDRGLLAAAALGARRGGDDDRATAAPPAADRPRDHHQRPSTGTTGTTERERPGPHARTARRRARTGRRRARVATTRGAPAQRLGQGGSAARRAAPATRAAARSPAAQPGDVDKVAKTVCNSFLPKQIERDLEGGQDRARGHRARLLPRLPRQAQRKKRRTRLPRPGLKAATTTGVLENEKGRLLASRPSRSTWELQFASQIAGCAVVPPTARRLPDGGTCVRRRLRRPSGSRRRSRCRSARRRGPSTWPSCQTARLPSRRRPGCSASIVVFSAQWAPIVAAAGADAGHRHLQQGVDHGRRSRPRRARSPCR